MFKLTTHSQTRDIGQADIFDFGVT